MINANPETLKVSSTTAPASLGGAIAHILRQQEAVDIEAVGASAVNQAVKAIAIARGYLASNGFDLVCVPTFLDIAIDGEERTGIRLAVARYRR